MVKYDSRSHPAGNSSRSHTLAIGLALALCFVSVAAFAAPKLEKLPIAPSALKQIAALESVKKAQTPAQSKLDSRLYLASLRQKNDPALGPLTHFRFMKPDRNGLVDVDIILVKATGLKPVVKRLEETGGVVKSTHVGFRRISARAALSSLEALAAMPEVLRVRQPMPYYKSALNTSEGDATHGAATARGLFSTTGVGVKVGVISDGVDSLAALQASGDLPPVVDVLAGQAGSGDEGSAMLEIVHDLAPGADLAFATAVTSEAQFAQNILDLAAAGCDIIVDDIIYLDESPFQDGPVAQAVNTVTAAGVLYFSSAGNEGNANDLTSGTWEGDFVPNGTPAALAGAGPVHNFGDGGQSILVENAFLNEPLLIWAEHYDLATGNASTDFDLYVMDGTLANIFDASTDVQDGVGGDDFPIEFVSGGTFTGERLVVAQFAAGATSTVPMFNLIVFRGELDDALATGGATRGHSAAAAAFSTAATPAADSFDGITPDGPYPGLFTGANESESFTSDGPRRILLSPAGAEITPGNRTSTGGVVRQKPDITAADGVSCAAPGFATFYGTSAAAPHAAAIAALMISAVPSLTPAQVRTHLLSTAIDIEIAGTDRDTGAGVVMAQAALQAAGATAVAFIDAGTPVPSQAIGDGDAFIENNEIFNLTIPLNNLGTTSATAITGVLTTSTPGVTINNGNSAYPDIAGGGSANNTTPFNFTVGPSVPCGSSIDFILTVTYTGGTSPQAFPFSFRVGEPGTPQTFSYVGPVVPIADSPDLTGTNPGAVAIASLLVAGLPGGVWDIDFRFDGTACSNAAGSATVGLDHTFVSDLELTLRSPGGTTVLMGDEPDGNGNNFCQTVLNDEGGGSPIQTAPSASAPFTGSFIPNAPLSALHGATGNGTWQLEVQDFFNGDTGNIRAYSLIITPAICNAPPLQANVFGTKTVAGTFAAGSNVVYTVTLTNTGGIAQPDNATNEFDDVLPGNLTLVSASASSGTAVANVGLNTVTWNGALAAVNGSVTITITATVNNVPPGTVISNQGTIHYDTEANGSNEASRLTDDPGVGGATDPTSFTVVGAIVSATKTVTGSFVAGGAVTYTVTLTNSGNATAGDNTGDELTDVLPSSLTLVSASASSGTAVATIGTNTVTWNGAIPASGSVTITINATINAGTAGGTVVSNQGTASYDSNVDSTNDTSVPTDDPGVGGATDPTNFTVLGGTVSASKTVTGTFVPGGAVTYTVTLTNNGSATTGDNTGDELTDVLPSNLTLVSASASSGTAVATVGTNTVTWNGAIPASGSVTITINATINTGTAGGTVVSNQGTASYDSNGDSTNDSSVPTDDPGVGGATDPTNFTVLAALVTGTKTVSAGPYTEGGNVTYTITLTNSGNATAPDSAGAELTDVLPASLTLVSANASSGTAVANVGTNTVTWNGAIPASGSVTITINATIDAGTAGATITNQGTIAYDANNDGTNESGGVTDDPGTGTSNDGTAIVVEVEGAAIDDVTKSVSGSFRVGGSITYTIVINNTGDSATGDNPGNELTDTLPSSLTLVSASATSGTAVANIGTNTVTWNGSIPQGGSVTITIQATIENVPPGTVISNQATHIYDSDGDGANDTTVLSDNPATAAVDDPTSFALFEGIPSLSTLGLIMLALCTAIVALKVLKG